jgi:hypothetical protein
LYAASLLPHEVPVYNEYIQRKTTHSDSNIDPFSLVNNVFGSILYHHLQAASSTQ